MRVALVVPVFPQLSETFIAAKAVGLARRGVDVHVVCGASTPAHWAAYGHDHPVHALHDRVHVAPPTAVTRGWLGGLVGVPPAALAARRDVARYLTDRSAPLGRRSRDLYLDLPLAALRPDLVHIEFGSSARGRTALRDRLDCALTVSFRGHDLNFVGLDDPHHYDEVWHRTDGVHLLGQDLWRRARARGAPADLPATIITPAVDAGAMVPPVRRPGELGSPGRPLRVVSVGRLAWAKGYEDALEAVALLRARGIAVEHRIVGGGPYLEAVAFWRHQLGLDDVVDLVGAVPPGQVAAHHDWADVLLHAAISEGFCNAVLEAQARGLAVVTTDADGLGENVAHTLTGLVVPRRDPAALADGLAHYATDGPARLAAGAAGRQRALTGFRVEDQLDAWEDFHERAVARRRAR
jgi:colanic acid/amylovoran biosynthesis glycosyltransferase